MPGLLCCGSDRQPSPDLPNNRYVDSSNDNSYGLLRQAHTPASTASLDTSKSEEGVQEIREIFAFSSQDANAQEMPQSSRNPNIHLHPTSARARHKGSSSRLHDVLRKRLSRDSVTSGRSSERKSKSTLSEEDIERRRELRRALHRRLQEEILTDRRASEGGYDTDAEPIVVPNMTKSRSVGTIRISPRHLSNVLRRLESQPLLGNVREWGATERIENPKSALHVSLADTTDAQALIPGDQARWADYTTKQVISASESLTVVNNIWQTSEKERNAIQPPEMSNGTSPKSTLQRSNTVIRAPRSQLVSLQRTAIIKPFNVEEAPPSPELQPLRLPSITMSVQHSWQLSSDANCGASRSLNRCDREIPMLDVDKSKHEFTGRSEHWLRGASILLGPTFNTEGLEHTSRGSSDSKGACQLECNPRVEDLDFGGVDGEENPDHSRARPVPDKNLDSTEAVGLIEMANLRDPDDASRQRQPAPRAELLITSPPQLQGILRHQRGQSSGEGSMKHFISTRHGRQSSSSGLASTRVPLAWGSVLQDNASSIYPSQAGSLMSSPSSSVLRIHPNLSDRFIHLGNSELRKAQFKTWNNSLADGVSYSDMSQGINEAQVSRRRTIDTTSFHSSTDSFRAQELAAAELRIIAKPKAFTIPKRSRFVEELEDESKSTAMLRKNFLPNSKRTRKPSLASFDGSDEWYHMSERQGYNHESVNGKEDSAAKLWERALRDHAEQEGNLFNIRLGNIPAKVGHGSLQTRVEGSKSKGNGLTLQTVSAVNLRDPTLKNGNPRIIITETAPPGKKTEVVQGSPTSSMASWGRFPSHNRAERCLTPAGEADKVIARDFAREQDIADVTKISPRRRFSLLGNKKKSRSMTFGRNMFKSWSRLYKSKSTELKGYHRAFRSSVSVEGVLEYPELEILPPSPPPLPSPKDDERFITFPEHRGPESIASQESGVRTVLRRNMADRSAKVWSRLYEDCVQYPRDTDEASVVDASGSFLHPSSALNETTEVVIHDPSFDFDADMCGSALDFQRSLEVQVAQARENALQAAEKAWAT
ncbi:hypothetical protein MMC24_007259 [Lignoscripta atroalba]|nr:hypothetical protein [Lignoscripta atroalba]